MDASEARKLEMFFLPFWSQGHMIPLVHAARLFAARGVKVTIITTPYNALLFQKFIDRDIECGLQIILHKLKFPFVEAGLPEGIENFSSVTTPEMSQRLYIAMSMLQPQIEQLFKQSRPDCIISDMFFPWTADVAAQLGIPRLAFFPTCFFSLCVLDSLERYEPHQKLQSDTETFVVPGLPDQIEMTRNELPDHLKFQTPLGAIMKQISESIPRSYGVLVNSFYELEKDYVEHYRSNIVKKAWPLGPISLYNKDTSDEAAKGSKAECLSWLDSKDPNSVLYVCFGSMTRFTNAQLFEIAMGLQASGYPFVWVVRKDETSTKEKDEEEERWLPEGFEEKMLESKKGLIIRGWAPQVLILDHPAIGGFLTHTGFNSVLESVSAAVPMITWPLYADQFDNEKLVTQVLKIGVEVNGEGRNTLEEEAKVVVKREKIEKAVIRVMNVGDEAEQIRKRVRDLGEIAKGAVEEGGSSYISLTSLIEDIRLCTASREKAM